MGKASWSWFYGVFSIEYGMILLISLDESRWLDACRSGNSVIKWVQITELK